LLSVVSLTIPTIENPCGGARENTFEPLKLNRGREESIRLPRNLRGLFLTVQL